MSAFLGKRRKISTGSITVGCFFASRSLLKSSGMFPPPMRLLSENSVVAFPTVTSSVASREHVFFLDHPSPCPHPCLGSQEALPHPLRPRLLCSRPSRSSG